jgi:L-alanine-DL-glutamate epimerase-like enolase superfamily enzyme
VNKASFNVASGEVAIEKVAVEIYRIPTDLPESDGTIKWDSTTLVLVLAKAGRQTGLGYTYADAATANLINDLLAGVVQGRNAMAIPANWEAMARRTRNLGRPGIVSMAISAVDTALWDLKARLLDVPLVALLGAARESVPIYGSGGFTSYTDAQLQKQLAGWIKEGIPRVKMKIGRDAKADIQRVRLARQAIGPTPELFVDANGAYSRKQALAQAERFTEFDVTWFEEPVSSDDLPGLRLMRDRSPAGMDIAAGEYGYESGYFLRMIDAGAVDVLQADATRCGGITGFLRAAAICDAFHLPLSAHTAPTLHAHVGCAAPRVRHLEYFHDHVRIENMFFDGVLQPVGGELRPDLSRPGLGIDLKKADIQRFAA